jgi:hypothetical protein
MIARALPSIAATLPSLLRAARTLTRMTDAERHLEQEFDRFRRAQFEEARCNRMIRACMPAQRQLWVDRLERAVLGVVECRGAVAQARRAVELERVRARGGRVG